MKRDPLLADFLAVSANDCVVRPHIHSSLMSTLYGAKRFTLDRDATLHIARAIRDHPRLVADAHDFALAPFESMWIEFDYPEWFEIISGTMADRAHGDKRVGYLYAGANVYTAALTQDNQAGWFPVMYKRHRPFTVEQELQFAESAMISRAGIDALYWGSSFDKLTMRDSEGIRVLRANHSAELLPSFVPPASVPGLMMGANGDLRNIIALLIFLNRTSNIQSVERVPMSHRMINRRPATMLAHSVIRLTVDPAPMIMKLCAGDGVWRRLHDVRGHFCHNRVARETPHEHDWIERVARETPHEHDWIERDALQWACACGGLRWWRREHRRGFEEKGIVSSEYEVGA